MIGLDKIDAALLESLQEDARTPIKTLTKKSVSIRTGHFCPY